MGRYELSIYPIQINERWINRIVVDGHVKKHQDITNDIIIDLVNGLAWDHFLAEGREGPYYYFAELRNLCNKQYRLVWVFEDNKDYIGIITVFRDSKRR